LNRIIFGLGLLLTGPLARADLFGADVGVLTQILAENIQQLIQLEQVVEQGTDQAEFLQQLNSGIENSMGLLRSLPVKDDNILANLTQFQGALSSLNNVYGSVPRSEVTPMQTLHDQTVAESLRMVNSFKDFSDQQEQNSIMMEFQSREASPKGAARMQAETSAEILRSLSQLIRLNSQMLKMQSEQFAMSNKSNKDSVKNFQRLNTDFGHSFQGLQSDMGLVKF
jgi:P2-related tail formation protein